MNSRISNIDLIENIYVQEFNKDYVNLKIKYLGKLEKIINQLKNENINLRLINDQWLINTIKYGSTNVKISIFKKILRTRFFCFSLNNFSAFKLIDGWPNWPVNG